MPDFALIAQTPGVQLKVKFLKCDTIRYGLVELHRRELSASHQNTAWLNVIRSVNKILMLSACHISVHPHYRTRMLMIELASKVATFQRFLLIGLLATDMELPFRFGIDKQWREPCNDLGKA